MAEFESEKSDEQFLAEISTREKQVVDLLAKKDKKTALKVSLCDPPLGSKSDEIKNKNAQIVEKVFNSITEAEIPEALKNLDPDTCDILMKYIYRSMANNVNCSILLKIHAQLADKCGHGTIIRAMADRKTV